MHDHCNEEALGIHKIATRVWIMCNTFLNIMPTCKIRTDCFVWCVYRMRLDPLKDVK